MKKLQPTATVLLSALLCAALAGCGETTPELTRLSAPQNFRIVNNKLIWDTVKNATGYSVSFYGTEQETNRTYIDLPYIVSEKAVDFKVYAIGDGEAFENSEQAVYSSRINSDKVTRGLTYTLTKDETGYSVSDNNSNLVGAIFIPDYYEGLPVTEIKNNAFIKSIPDSTTTLPNGQTVIIMGGQKDNTGLTSIRLPDTLHEIGYSAFSRCTALTEIVIPEGVKIIKQNTFEDNKKLKKVTLPSTLETIEPSAFVGCEKLSIINFPKSIKSIGAFAFLDCTLLTNITIPENCEVELFAFPNSTIINKK